jgi:seryl-tRNA synthetase
VQEKLTHVFDKVLDIEFRKCNVTPWWMAQEGEKKAAETQGVGTVDFEGYLPFRGKRSTSEWLEFQNVSVIGDKYPKAFGVKAQRGELWSGCGGGSLQRWACAFLAQKGLDAANWPEEVRRRVKLQNEVEFA